MSWFEWLHILNILFFLVTIELKKAQRKIKQAKKAVEEAETIDEGEQNKLQEALNKARLNELYILVRCFLFFFCWINYTDHIYLYKLSKIFIALSKNATLYFIICNK